MIKINERFSMERTSDQWILYDTQKSTHKESKTGFKTSRSYYPRLKHVVDEVIDRCPQGATSLREVAQRMEMVKADVFRAINGGGK